MSTATKQTSTAADTTSFVSNSSEEQSTLGVVQKLQQKLRSTRENLERLRIDPSAEAEVSKPHIVTEKIANQLRLVNQERMELLQQLGAQGGERLRDVVTRMQQELDQLRKQNEDLQKRPQSQAQSGLEQAASPAAHPEPVAPEPSLAVPESQQEEEIWQDEPAPKMELERTPEPMTRPPKMGNAVPRPKTVLEQELLRKAKEQQERNGESKAPSAEEPRRQSPASPSPNRDSSSSQEMEELLVMLDAKSIDEGMSKLREMRDVWEQFPQQKESLLNKNKELTSAVQKMHADQIALCKRFNVNSLSEMARLIMETMDNKKQNAESSPKELSSWVAVADLLQDWDKKITTGDPNHTVKVERTGGRWNLSANWLQK
ncbi:hypothetical protein Pla110_44620 [Polystyrenella longa]|uniref:Uncharacterized protein n=1 Tax=Polystyrenella longa TaxID=2528007 RepID=A0A518CTY3_9PLAN|nr:hypothetical protein [Polystyrenella longa]QDU82700.1 hypothetical protein Pla110_44620 [Polystyrenella longa]